MTQIQDKNSWGRFDFLGISKYITAFSITLTFFSAGLISVRGLTYGVDFAGGIEIQTAFKASVGPAKVREFMKDMGFPKANVQALGTDNHQYLIKIGSGVGKTDKEVNEYIQATVAKIKAGLASTFSAQGAQVLQVNTVGPQVGAELRRNGILAGFYCLLLILIYVGLRFDYFFSPGAVFCVFHDAIITLGIYSLFHWEVTTQTMAAVLTVIGYSMNDTIVIFDRIRENQGIYRGKNLYWISNRSINETLSRTILTYVCTYMTVASMFFFTTGVIHDFSLAMMIGMFLGCYSTVYVATPLMLLLDKYNRYRKSRVQVAA